MKNKKRTNNFVFGNNPDIYKRRSKFNLDHTHKTSLNVGELIPISHTEVYPGDTFNVKVNQINRLTSTWIKAPLDDLDVNIMHFFVPYRTIMKDWPKLMGENTATKWAQTEDINVPQITFEDGNGINTLADKLGIPLLPVNSDITVSALPFRAYAKIWDEWFRDQNNQDPMFIDTDNVDRKANIANWAPNNYLGKVAKVNKYHDYFTSALPAPQKGDPVSIGLTGDAPIIAGEDHLITGQNYPGNWNGIQSRSVDPFDGDVGTNKDYLTVYNPDTDQNSIPTNIVNQVGNRFVPSNLYANLQGITAVNVNDLRFAVQLQRLLERDARGGTRYTEIILNHFGVQSPDARLQRSEFLGGNKQPITINQVVNTAGNQSGTAPEQGAIAGYSLSGGENGYIKSFTEHGIVMSLACIRHRHTYQQGIKKSWLRKTRYQFYDPVFANIGEQPIEQIEIDAINGDKANVFGYQEAWNDLRYTPNLITGQMRSGSGTGYDVWHFGDEYATAPVISEEFLEEKTNFVDRTISVSSAVSDQFIMDIYIQNTAIRPLPTYSVPGYLDHN